MTNFSDEINDECDHDEPENFEESNDNGSSERCCSSSESYNHLDININSHSTKMHLLH